MKLTKTKLLSMALATGSLLLAVGSANAQNTLHGPSDLVLTFQNPGGSQGASQTIIVALGNVSTIFRDGGSFSSINIGSQLAATFGSTWYDETTLWMGAVGFRGTSDASNLLLDQDPHRTIYATQARNSVGTVGEANSTAPGISSSDTMTSTVNAINTVKNDLETIGSNTAVGVVATSTSDVDNQNPFLGQNQSTAYTAFANGVQDSFFVGSFGTFGSAGTIELALDLYRYQARNDISGQYGFNDPVRQGEFLGTITLNQAGDVGFTAAVPEPSTYALIAISLIAFVIFRRRSKAAKSIAQN